MLPRRQRPRMSVEDTLLAVHNAEIGGASRPDSSPFYAAARQDREGQIPQQKITRPSR